MQVESKFSKMVCKLRSNFGNKNTLIYYYSCLHERIHFLDNDFSIISKIGQRNEFKLSLSYKRWKKIQNEKMIKNLPIIRILL